jgi:hypothetical protein
MITHSSKGRVKRKKQGTKNPRPRNAIALVADDAGLSKPENRLWREMVVQRYGQTLDLATVG